MEVHYACQAYLNHFCFSFNYVWLWVSTFTLCMCIAYMWMYLFITIYWTRWEEKKCKHESKREFLVLYHSLIYSNDFIPLLLLLLGDYWLRCCCYRILLTPISICVFLFFPIWRFFFYIFSCLLCRFTFQKSQKNAVLLYNFAANIQ